MLNAVQVEGPEYLGKCLINPGYYVAMPIMSPGLAARHTATATPVLVRIHLPLEKKLVYKIMVQGVFS